MGKQRAGELPPGAAATEPNLTGRVDIAVGMIHDVFGHTGAYVVRLLGGGTRLGTRLSGDSFTPLGSREVGHLNIGDGVICLLPQNSNICYIIGALPPQVFDPRFVLPSALVSRSCVGFFYDQAHYTPYENEKTDMANFSGGRPVDTLQGDWGHINELGMAVWIGRLMAQLRASDVAKLEMFWGDDLVRLFGWNFQRFTAAREFHCFDDEGEYGEVELWTPFMWESLGSYEPGKDVFDKNEGDTGGIKKGNEKSFFEPKEEKQTMSFRGMTLRGFLGDGVKEFIALLPSDATDIAKRDDDKDPRGVLEVHQGLDGAYHVRSAKEILLEKSLILPVPRWLLDPDDPAGDTGTGDAPNYKPAGYYGDGPEQEKKPFVWPGDQDEDDSLGRVANLWEYQAYLFGQFGLQVIDAHEKDWKTAEEADLKIDDETANRIDDKLFKGESGSGLQFEPAQKLPQYGEIQIDQRTGHTVRYYQSRSFIQLTDDGSVIIEDGYGSQIVMSGGNIYQQCQGDIFNRPGRSFITWAPRDIIARAGWCAELSAAKRDVRIKGENNVHILAGDGDKGCVLIECRAQNKPAVVDWQGKYGEDIESSGIIIKAEESAVDIWSKRVFVGATKDDEGIVELSSGRGKTVIAGGTVGVEALTQYGILVGPGRSASACPASAQFVITPGAAKLLAKLDMVGDLGLWSGCAGSGKLEMDGELKAKGDIGSVGSIYCDGSMAANGMISTSIHNTKGSGRAPGINSQGGATEGAAGAAKALLYQQFESETLNDSKAGAGNQDVWDEIGFSFRLSDEHYKTTDFKVFESRSQQLYRAYGLTSKKWDEPVVEAPDGTETRPHPGHAAWTGNEGYEYADPGDSKDVTYTTGVAKSRADQTEEGPELKKAALVSEYIVTAQETA
jgi:hypothetical protein